jgi:hypothetical protein
MWDYGTPTLQGRSNPSFLFIIVKLSREDYKIMLNLDSALENGIMPENVILHRDTAYNWMHLEYEKSDVFNNPELLIGKTIVNPIYTSTSFENVRFMLRDTEIWLDVPKGYVGCQYIKSVAYDSAKYQEEVLFKRGLKYKVYDAKMQKGKLVLYAEELK